MLPRKFALHDVSDVEAFAVAILKPRAASIPSRDHEDAVAYLIETAWELSLGYDSEQMRRFSVWAGYVLRQRLVDWERRQYGRTRWVFADRVYERPRPILLSYEDLRTHNSGHNHSFRGEKESSATDSERGMLADSIIAGRHGAEHGLLDHSHGGRIQDVLGLQRARGGKRARADTAGSRGKARPAA